MNAGDLIQSIGNFSDGVYKGINIESRYELPDEILAMQRAIDQVPGCLLKYIESIFCDSKAGNWYEIILNVDARNAAEKFALMAHNIFKKEGHNGIFVGYPNGVIYVDPFWNDDDPQCTAKRND